MSDNQNLLEINNLQVKIKTKTGYVSPIDGLNLTIKPGETLALIGESGCGKSMTANAIMQLLTLNIYYTKKSSIRFAQQELLDKSEIAMRQIRGHDIAIIFQDPMTALNPVLTIGNQLLEILKTKQQKIKKQTSKKKCEIKNDTANHSVNTLKQQAMSLLAEVGLSNSERLFKAYPHQLSGGMRQRVVIAMALAAEPKLLIADEPTTALDVTIQRQILQLLQKLQAKYDMSLLFISHDVGVVAEMADRVAVMYAGYIVELANTPELIANPRHPYTKMLLNAQPDFNKRQQKLAIIKGHVPSLTERHVLCRFKDRCPIADIKCQSENPELQFTTTHDADDHLVRCFYQEKVKSLPLYAEDIACLDATGEKQFGAGAIAESERDEKVPQLEQLSNNVILSVANLKVYFPITKGILKRTVDYVKAVDDVTFDVKASETLTIVGESGSGKTTVAKAIMGLLPAQGKIDHGHNLIQMIFQDPYSALNPKMMVAEILQEGYNSIYKKRLTDNALINLLDTVGLPSTALYKYPHMFSGGQRQRISVARALAVRPKILILDEPTSALDLSVQAQVLNLLKDLQQHYSLAYLFITHNISVVSYMADYVAVMYAGKIVEYGNVDQVINSPQDDYTKKLLAAVPKMIAQ